MKTIIILLSVCILLAAPSVASASGGTAPYEIVLTADQVQTATDIESAFSEATAWGSRPGVVVLDGRLGPFQYDPAVGDDFDINIFYSNLTLRGINNAVIMGGGIFMDGMALQNITIDNLGMICPADCIASWGGPHRNITISRNQLIAGGIGIQVAQTDGWRIKKNTVQADWVALHVVEARGIDLRDNRVAGYIPIMLHKTNDCKVVHNTVLGAWQGILLTSPSAANTVIANTIANVEAAGIALEPGTQSNHVHGNLVKCAPGYECLTVDAYGDASTDNVIRGNRP